LKQAELGAPIAELCRQHGISEQSYYRWKKIYGGMEPSEARELKALREENTKLKRLVSDLSLDKVMLQDILQKKYDPPRVCKRLLLRVWLVGLPKCIRPTGEGRKPSGLDGDPRTPGLINSAVYDDRFFEQARNVWG